MLIAEDADKAQTADDREKLLKEFLDKSNGFLKVHPSQLNVWLIRAAASVELGEPRIGWEAGKSLRTLGAEKINDPKTDKVLAMLDRKGWLSESEPVAESSKAPQMSGSLSQAIAAVEDAFQKFGHFTCKEMEGEYDDNGIKIPHVTEYEMKVTIDYPQIVFIRTYKHQHQEGATISTCNLSDLNPKISVLRKSDVEPPDKPVFYYTEFYSSAQSVKIQRDSKRARDGMSLSKAKPYHTEFTANFVYDIGFPDENVAQLVLTTVNRLLEVVQIEHKHK